MGEPEVELVHCIVWNTGMGWEGGVGLCSICWKGRGMDGWMDVVVLDSPAGEDDTCDGPCSATLFDCALDQH